MIHKHQRRARAEAGTVFDFIVVGGGAAGCVLASRLSENADRTVLLIEAGMDTPPGQVPADILDPYPRSYANPAYRWPVSGHARRAGDSPAAPLLQGSVMGGGSSIMGMIMLRGTPDDYDGWAQDGAAGWSWQDVLPYFRKLENDVDFDGAMHGQGGPTVIRRHSVATWPHIAGGGLAYARERQIPFIADMNGDFADGYGALPIAGPPEQRTSSATAYLTAEVRRRKNLAILSGTKAEHLLFDGPRVVGVEVRNAEGTLRFKARETILSMGALLTPAFMLAEGIGDPAQLQAAGVTVRAAVPGVGQNLQNHAAILVLAHLRRRAVQRRPQRNHNNSMFRYSSGLAGAEPSDMGLVVGSRASWHEVARRMAHFSSMILKPASRGQVSLGRGADGQVQPVIEFNLLGDERDRLRLRDGLIRIGDIVSSDPYRGLIGPAVGASRLANAARFSARTPWNAVRTNALAALLDFVPGFGDFVVDAIGARLEAILADETQCADFIARNTMPLAHHAGTCRMGPRQDPRAVVDAAGAVHAVPGLRVVDASVMPSVPRGNTNLPVLMIAEKIADAIRAIGRN